MAMTKGLLNVHETQTIDVNDCGRLAFTQHVNCLLFGACVLMMAQNFNGVEIPVTRILGMPFHKEACLGMIEVSTFNQHAS